MLFCFLKHSLKNDGLFNSSYTATKRQLASNKAKKEVRNENKRSKSRNKKEMVEIMEDTDLDMEELPEEMKIAIHSVKKP